MKHRFRPGPAALLLLVLPLALHLSAQARPTAAANHVVIISLDGFTARALADPALPLPTLRRLARAGAMAKAMRPVEPDSHLGESHRHRHAA